MIRLKIFALPETFITQDFPVHQKGVDEGTLITGKVKFTGTHIIV